MPRLPATLIFAGAAVTLATSVYAWRARELHSLQQQLEKASASPAKPPTESESLLRHLNGLSATASFESEAKSLLQKLQALTPEQLDAFCDAVLKEPLPPQSRKIAYAALAAATVKLPDREAAAITLKLSRKDEDARRLFEKRVGKWFQSDQAGVVAWLTPHLTDGSMAHLRESFREQVKMFVEFSPVMLDPVANLETLRQAPEGLRGSLLREGMKRAKNTADRHAIAEALLTWPETKSQAYTVSEVMPVMTATDGFEETTRWLNGLTNVDPERGAEARVALATGKEGNPDIAKKADAILKTTAAPAAAEFAGRLVAMWLRQDHRGAAEWINAHHGAAWQDQARQAFARGITTSEPADAMTWAFSISEPGLRSETAVHVFTRWKTKDAAAAGAFLTGSTVPDDLRQVLER